MCGIMGYVGARSAASVLIDGLARLEYRGYDSAGVAIVQADGTITVMKTKGRVASLAAMLEEKKTDGAIGIGHTRWATHGAPTEKNAHPHGSGDGMVFGVHNGIIENYQQLKDKLLAKGHKFKSETDSEAGPQRRPWRSWRRRRALRSKAMRSRWITYIMVRNIPST